MIQDPKPMLPITAVILTFNEELHIRRLLENLTGFVERICIVDSFSTDKTLKIAAEFGAEVIQNPWKNYATQMQFGLDSFDITSPWTMRIDADEYLEQRLKDDVRRALEGGPSDTNAFYFRRKIVFLGQPITHGNFYPLQMLRLWRTGRGRIEARWMDEHIVVDDVKAEHLAAGDLVDHNLNDLTWWTAKHNGYATREVYDLVEIEETRRRARQATATDISGQASRKRFLKEAVYSRLPSGLRGLLYFIYRYVLGRGFLDGKGGFYFCVLQAYWYRMLVEAKMYELKQRAEAAGLTPYQLLVQEGVFEDDGNA